ncbi:hypothetical protein G9A89_006958 [Geosiphon pyriformis]|nr:hypothetical protein G9A89_006958 [Geosiphon pyriformis]
MEFKIGDQVLLYYTKAEKQWSRKFDPKWDSLFYIHEALGNGAYKLRLEDRILKKKERLPPAYWFYKIGEQLDLKTPYEDLSQKTFNKEAIQQVEKFIRKNNLTLHYKATYQLYATFQHCPNVLLNGSMKTIMINNIERITNQQFKDLQKAILEATIEHYINKVMITDTYGFAGAQF